VNGVDGSVADGETKSGTTAAPREQSFFRRILPKLAISLVLGALFAWLVSRGGVPLIPSADGFAHVSWGLLALYPPLYVVTHFFRASRWRFLVRPVKRVPFSDVIALNWIGFFAIFALPLRLGEVARPAITKLRNGVSLSAGFGTIAVERVIDGLITSLCVAWALFALPMLPTDDELARALPFYGYLSLAVFGGAFIALGLFLWQRDLATKVTARIIGLVSKKLAAVLSAKVGGVADGVRSIGDLRLASGFLFETAIYWGTNACGMWLVGVACGLPMTFGHAVAIMGILAIGILLPAGPGLFGNFQLAVSVALRLYFAESFLGEQGSVYIFFLYTIQATLIVVMGIVPLYLFHIPLNALLKVSPDPVPPSTS
jgi:hypothetical protein